MERLTSAGFLVARSPWQAAARPQQEQSAVADVSDTVQLVNPFLADLSPAPAAPAPPSAPASSAEAPPQRASVLVRASMAGLAMLSLFGGPLTQAVAAQTPPSVTQAVATQPAPAQKAPATIDSLLARPLRIAPLPAPNPASRARLDKVESNARMEEAARTVGVPPNLVKAVAWQESNWEHTRNGSVTTRANLDSHGNVLSYDVGLMQINSRAHADAFPKVRTYDGNLQYGTRLLKTMVDRYGSEGVWHYNGDAEYQRRIEHHLEVQPWTVDLWQDHASALRSEQQMLEKTLDQKAKLVTSLESRVAAGEKQVERDHRAVASAPEARARTQAERTLASSTKTLAEARTRLEAARLDVSGSKARLAELPRLIDAAMSQAHAELDRVTAAEEAYTARLRAQQLAGTRDLIARLASEKQQATALVGRLEQMAKTSRAPELKGMTANAKWLRDRATSGEAAWKPIHAKLDQGKEVDLAANGRALRRSLDRVQADQKMRQELAARLETMTGPTATR